MRGIKGRACRVDEGAIELSALNAAANGESASGVGAGIDDSSEAAAKKHVGKLGVEG